MASGCRPLRKKLDEADARHGVPRKTFARLYRSGTNTWRKLHFQHAVRFYQSQRAAFESLKENPLLGELIEMIDKEVVAFDLRSRQLWLERLRYRFRCSDCIACTELVYRAYHRCGPLEFSLREVGGRMTLPAEELIHQALAQGFKVVASCNIGSGGILRGLKAELALHSTRTGI